jgi:hypothetical protein
VAFLVSVVHYVDNYVNYDDYPQGGIGPVPAPSATLVGLGWFVFTAAGAVGCGCGCGYVAGTPPRPSSSPGTRSAG